MLSPDAESIGTIVRSFDFSKFPNLQEVDIGVGWKGGSLVWIPTALSTLKPATSPHLSTIKLNFFRSPNVRWITGDLVKDAGNDLRWVADEVSRIEREFEGVVDFTVLRDLRFKAALDALNVRFRFCGVDETSLLIYIHPSI